MQHEIIFDGKKYISAKSASRLTGYTSDYIGQICRASKIDSRRIGRIWFVAEDEILAYSKTVRTGDHTHTIAPSHVNHPATTSTPDAFSSVPRSAKSSHVAATTAPHKIVFNKLSPVALLIVVGVFTTILFGVSIIPSLSSQSGETVQVEVKQTLASSPALVAPEVAAVVATSSISTYAAIQTSSLTDSQPALVAKAIMPVISFVNRLALVEYAVVMKTVGVDAACSAANDYCMTGGVYSGVVVAAAPENGTVEMNQAEVQRIRQNIEQSFSDEVKVSSDAEGTSGVIHPVLKNDSKDKYVYVVVPVKNK